LKENLLIVHSSLIVGIESVLYTSSTFKKKEFKGIVKSSRVSVKEES